MLIKSVQRAVWAYPYQSGLQSRPVGSSWIKITCTQSNQGKCYKRRYSQYCSNSTRCRSVTGYVYGSHVFSLCFYWHGLTLDTPHIATPRRMKHADVSSTSPGRPRTIRPMLPWRRTPQSKRRQQIVAATSTQSPTQRNSPSALKSQRGQEVATGTQIQPETWASEAEKDDEQPFSHGPKTSKASWKWSHGVASFIRSTSSLFYGRLGLHELGARWKIHFDTRGCSHPYLYAQYIEWHFKTGLLLYFLAIWQSYQSIKECRKKHDRRAGELTFPFARDFPPSNHNVSNHFR